MVRCLMYRPVRIKGYTLVELLVVLVIFGVILLLSSGMSSRTRDTFVAQQQLKTYLQSARIIRRKSMLITRNSNDKEWVHGIGIRFEKTGTQWRMTQFKALKVVQGNQFFYLSYPTNNPCIEIDWTLAEGKPDRCQDSTELKLKRLEGTVSQYLPESIVLDIRNGTATTATCKESVTIIYESINGEMHVYCGNSGIESPLTGPLDISVRMSYGTGGSFKYKLSLKSNGEINAIPL